MQYLTFKPSQQQERSQQLQICSLWRMGEGVIEERAASSAEAPAPPWVRQAEPCNPAAFPAPPICGFPHLDLLPQMGCWPQSPPPESALPERGLFTLARAWTSLIFRFILLLQCFVLGLVCYCFIFLQIRDFQLYSGTPNEAAATS